MMREALARALGPGFAVDGEGRVAALSGDKQTPYLTPADLLALARDVAAGDPATRTHPLTLNLLAAGVIVHDALLNPKSSAEEGA
jgi:hypothetical protein